MFSSPQISRASAGVLLFAFSGLSMVLAKPAADKSADQAGIDFFERHIRPILVSKCYECHSEAEDASKGGLLLDRESGWLEGGDSGKAVVPGNLQASLLITAIHRGDEDRAMPPKQEAALSDAEMKLLDQWVKRGAPGPADDIGDTEFSRLGDQTFIFGKAEDHWAFKPVDAIEPPKVDNPAWSPSPIDRFVFAKLVKNGLTPSPKASPRDLTRRLAYDLTGLPPASAVDYQKSSRDYVDELLDSPRFGEHFARMWLDVARYGDTADTYRPDTKTPHYYPYAFTYRDYVIDAFNADKPYDQFIREQLAADLMGVDERAPELAALGFLAVSPKRSMSADFIDDVIDATTRGLLGMTVACSRCHDHKFEPIPTADYYSLYGVFGSLERAAPMQSGGFPVIDGYERGEEEVADYEQKLAVIQKKIEEAGEKTGKGNNRSLAEALEETELAELLLFHDGAPARAMTVKERKNPIDSFIFLRGEASQRGEQVPRRFLRILDPDQPAFASDNSGRLELANKIADPENPLTARVFVNRVWGALTGSYIVDTPSDFGLQGAAPTHPELLDWLAADFVAHGWSLKHLVSSIVNSRTYQQRSLVRADIGDADPENRLYHRGKLQRLEIEEIRDSILAVSGQLDARMHGRAGLLLEGDYTKRRSIYGYINRFNLDPTLRAFDFPSPNQSQESRNESIVAPQALFTMNSAFVIDQAKALVDGLDFQADTTREQRIEAIYQAVLHRSAEEGEHTRINRFADIEKGRKVNPWPLVAQALFMSNEFLYVD